MSIQLTGPLPKSSLRLLKNIKRFGHLWVEVHVRDAGLDRAIDAAGGIAQLARKIGIAQPSVSNWNRVPAQRVIVVEAATGVSRKQLRPDLYSEPAVEGDSLDPVHAGREGEYALLAPWLSCPPWKALLGEIARWRADATALAR